MIVLLADVPAEIGGVPVKHLMYTIGGAALGLAALLVVFRVLTTKGKAGKKGSEDRLDEDLSEYPPPTGRPGPRRLTVTGIPVRVRLVIVAPAGRAQPLSLDQAPALLEKVTPGLRDILETDRPRIRVWPDQLSVNGFSPKFQRHVTPPDDDSHWVLLSGPVRIGPRTILVGLALLADEPAYQEPLDMEPEDWRRMLRVERV